MLAIIIYAIILFLLWLWISSVKDELKKTNELLSEINKKLDEKHYHLFFNTIKSSLNRNYNRKERDYFTTLYNMRYSEIISFTLSFL